MESVLFQLSIFQYIKIMRRSTKQVKVGDMYIGSNYPVRVQSMLNTDTMDTDACVEQAIRIFEAGGVLVRITAPGVKEAKNLENIRAELRRRGYNKPLSADIHFNPEAAIEAAKHVEKVRINPGNFVDKRATFQTLTYTEKEYEEELTRLREKFTAFLDVCRAHGTAVRIGTNHGSLSDRIMSRYGNTPAGMVEATMEYLRVCKDEHFDDVVISLKSSDCRVMVDAVRLLVREMDREGMDYPLHLGVTEAGEGEDGRIRSAVGIGTLLLEGLGDTIRVSLTEDPENEIEVANFLSVSCISLERNVGSVKLDERTSHPVIVADISGVKCIDESVTSALDFHVDKVNDPVYGDLLRAGEKAPEIIYTEALGPELTKLPDTVTIVVPVENIDIAHVYNRRAVPLMSASEYARSSAAAEGDTVFVEIFEHDYGDKDVAEKLKKHNNDVIVLTPISSNSIVYRMFLRWLKRENITNRVIVRSVRKDWDMEAFGLMSAAHVGGLFLDRLVDGLWLSCHDDSDVFYGVRLSQNILQSAGVRRYKTEFISCPGCGRTLFNLQEAALKVKKAFGHLNRLKIAVMGCVVNGPGEMGDADYGYVGAGNGKVNLFRGKTMVRVGVPEDEAIEALKQLIQESGEWND